MYNLILDKEVLDQFNKKRGKKSEIGEKLKATIREARKRKLSKFVIKFDTSTYYGVVKKHLEENGIKTWHAKYDGYKITAILIQL